MCASCAVDGAGRPGAGLHREADHLLLTRFAPPSVLVSADLRVLQCRGDIRAYLDPAAGTAGPALTKILREGLLGGVRAALRRAAESGRPAREEHLCVRSHDGWRPVSVEVVPLTGGEGEDHHPDVDGFLILFGPDLPVGRDTPPAQMALDLTPGDETLTVSPIRDAGGHVVGASKMARDITRQHQTAERWRQSAAELAEIDVRKNEFLALLAHELRGPLAPIRSALQILRLSGGDVVQDTTQMMERQVAQLVRLVDDLLDVSRISRGRIELRKAPADLRSVVKQAVESTRPAFQAKGVELTVSQPHQPLMLDADAARLVQVLGNLLHNACKFTRQGDSVWLTLEHVGDEAVVCVRDDGMGIDAATLPRIFEMFVQGDTSLERCAGGLGIGLSLVRTLVGLHGGTVQAASAGVGRGSEFVVRLPIAAGCGPAAAVAAVATAAARPPAGGHRVLVVDDNRDAAQSLAELLRLEGHEIRVAYDGLQALALAEAFRPALALVDIGMPKLNGYDTARKVREQAWGQAIVLVALTGWGQQEARQASDRAGFDAHLVKPVDLGDLQGVLARLPPVGSSRTAGG